MKIAYFDCFSGISGDMTLGALIDAGLDFELLKGELDKLGLPDYEIGASREMRGYITGTKFNVEAGESHHHRGLTDINAIINNADISQKAKTDSLAIFDRLGTVEAAIHNTTKEKIHFHEVGAVDSIVDIVGTAIGIDLMGIEKCHASVIPLGSGTAKAAHGILPVPAPATIKLLENVKVRSSGQNREMVTPTGAAILTHYCKSFGPIPGMHILSTGYGAGYKDVPEMPNMLRLVIGQSDPETMRHQMEVIEANIDDMNPEFYDYIFEKLFGAGALDVYLVPIHMKKNRPANLLTVLAHKEDLEKLASIILTETTTFGFRSYTTSKILLKREQITVETQYGPISVKTGYFDGGPSTIAPEYEDCKKAAKKASAPIKTVYAEAFKIAEEQLNKTDQSSNK
jgi:pyridinium-3,5-bisthiocarboxylic acid mononucleotide nickel chelatase